MKLECAHTCIPDKTVYFLLGPSYSHGNQSENSIWPHATSRFSVILGNDHQVYILVYFFLPEFSNWQPCRQNKVLSSSNAMSFKVMQPCLVFSNRKVSNCAGYLGLKHYSHPSCPFLAPTCQIPHLLILSKLIILGIKIIYYLLTHFKYIQSTPRDNKAYQHAPAEFPICCHYLHWTDKRKSLQWEVTGKEWW